MRNIYFSVFMLFIMSVAYTCGIEDVAQKYNNETASDFFNTAYDKIVESAKTRTKAKAGDPMTAFPEETLKCVHGILGEYGQCSCFYRWNGPTCTDRICKFGWSQLDGTCVCHYPEYFGEFCDKTCYNGKVVGNRCICEKNYRGATCKEYYCADCSQRQDNNNPRRPKKLKYEYIVVCTAVVLVIALCLCMMRLRRRSQHSNYSQTMQMPQDEQRNVTPGAPEIETAQPMVPFSSGTRCDDAASDNLDELPPPSYEEAIKDLQSFRQK